MSQLSARLAEKVPALGRGIPSGFLRRHAGYALQLGQQRLWSHHVAGRRIEPIHQFPWPFIQRWRILRRAHYYYQLDARFLVWGKVGQNMSDVVAAAAETVECLNLGIGAKRL